MPDTSAAIRWLEAPISSRESKPGPAMIGDLITLGIRHVIGMTSVLKRGKRVADSALLLYEPRERRIPNVVLAKWDWMTDTRLFPD
jgi:pilus assembly protein CpaF